jgi:hypothetical protein
MRLPGWIRTLLRGSRPAKKLVPFYDVPSRQLVHIPPSELRPGCIQARVEGIEGIVWLVPQDLSPGEVRHPAFGEDVLAYIRDIQEAFEEHRSLSVEEWEEGFRRDSQPLREIALWSHAADVYRLFGAGWPEEWRRDLYRLIVACLTTSREAVWHVVKLSDLPRSQAERVVERFFGPATSTGADEVP